MSDPGIWLSILTVAISLVAGWVKLNSRISTSETKAAADKTTCDQQMALIRAEVVAVETRANDHVGQLREQLTRIDGKVDRLLERK